MQLVNVPVWASTIILPVIHDKLLTITVPLPVIVSTITVPLPVIASTITVPLPVN